MNIYDFLEDTNKEVVDILNKGKNVRIERIVSTGQVSKEGFYYDQDEHEWILLLEGYAKIGFLDGKVISLSKGDTLFIPAHVKHNILFTSKNPCCIWLCVFYKDWIIYKILEKLLHI